MFKKLRKAKAEVAALPRDAKVLQAICNELLTRSAKAQYQKFLCEQELLQVNQELMSINNEGAARQQLDKEESLKSEEVDKKKEENAE